MPKQRRLTEEDKENVVQMVELKSNKKLLQNHIKSATGKNIILKDLHNLAAKIKQTTAGANQYEDLIKEMKKYPSKYLKNLKVILKK